jgi:drug/metabolite transporter (DMT)-like permease
MELSNYVRRIIWVCLVIGLTLYFKVESSNLESDSQVQLFEVGLLALIVLGILSFPVGVFILLLATWIFRAINPEAGNIDTEMTIWLSGLSCLIGGYFQWFYLVPKLINHKRIAEAKKHREGTH